MRLLNLISLLAPLAIAVSPAVAESYSAVEHSGQWRQAKQVVPLANDAESLRALVQAIQQQNMPAIHQMVLGRTAGVADAGDSIYVVGCAPGWTNRCEVQFNGRTWFTYMSFLDFE